MSTKAKLLLLAIAIFIALRFSPASAPLIEGPKYVKDFSNLEEMDRYIEQNRTPDEKVIATIHEGLAASKKRRERYEQGWRDIPTGR